jgi:nucleoside-diphosphate-sugar epimerase
MDHVRCITEPARGNPVKFPYRDSMRLPIHVEDISEIFTRVSLAEKPQHAVYNSGGETISMGDIAALVQKYLPDAKIEFEKETGGRELSGNYMMDNSRLVQEFEYDLAPYPQRVLEIINAVRADEGLPPVG